MKTTAETPAPALPQQASGANVLLRRRLLISAALLLGALLLGALPRVFARKALHAQTAALAVATVSVIKPERAPVSAELLLPGDIQAFQQTPIYARTNGYLKKWYADIGAHVKTGQLLAEIDAPEVEDQLHQARAELQQVQADHALAQLTAQRWQELLASNSVSQQETDAKTSDEQAKRALLQSAQSNLARLGQLLSYTRIYAPFDGVITARNIDVGALIDAGSAGGPARELFDLAKTDTLRVYADVPQDESAEVVSGTAAFLTLSQYAGRRFPGRVVRNSESINPVTRTLRIEVDIDNAGGELLPGAYAQLHLQLQTAQPGLSLPANTLLYRPEGVQVAVVAADNRVALKTITLARDLGTRVEVASGLDGSEAVILNPTDSISAGALVRVGAGRS